MPTVGPFDPRRASRCGNPPARPARQGRTTHDEHTWKRPRSSAPRRHRRPRRRLLPCDAPDELTEARPAHARLAHARRRLPGTRVPSRPSRRARRSSRTARPLPCITAGPSSLAPLIGDPCRSRGAMSLTRLVPPNLERCSSRSPGKARLKRPPLAGAALVRGAWLFLGSLSPRDVVVVRRELGYVVLPHAHRPCKPLRVPPSSSGTSFRDGRRASGLHLGAALPVVMAVSLALAARCSPWRWPCHRLWGARARFEIACLAPSHLALRVSRRACRGTLQRSSPLRFVRPRRAHQWAPVGRPLDGPRRNASSRDVFRRRPRATHDGLLPTALRPRRTDQPALRTSSRP